MSSKENGIWGMAFGCIFLVLLVCIGFSILYVNFKVEEPTPVVVSLPARWQVSYRFPDGRIFGYHHYTGSMGLFTSEGEMIWETEVLAPDYCWALPVGDEMLIWFLKYSPDATTVAFLRADGSLNWQKEFDFCSYDYPGLTDSGNFIFVGRDKVVCVSGEGEFLWSTPRPTTSHHYFLLHDGVIVAAGSNGSLAGMDFDGNLLWETDYMMVVHSVHLLEEAGLVLVYGAIGNSPHLFAVNFQGEKQWEYKPQAGTLGGVVLGQDGLIYYSNVDGPLHVLSQAGVLQPARNINLKDLWDLDFDLNSNVIQIQIQKNNPNPLLSFITNEYPQDEYLLVKYDDNDKLVWRYELGTTYRYLQRLGENGEVYLGVENDLLLFEP